MTLFVQFLFTYIGHPLKSQVKKEVVLPQPLNCQDTGTIDSVQAVLLHQKIPLRCELHLPQFYHQILSLYLMMLEELGIVTQLARLTPRHSERETAIIYVRIVAMMAMSYKNTHLL